HVNLILMQAHLNYTKGLPDQLVSSLVWNGQFGVQIFFAVSGFLITSTTLRRWGSLSRINIRDFYLLRFARIAPLFALLITVLTFLHLAHIKHFVLMPETGGLGRALLAAFTFQVNVLEARRGYLPGSWDILWSLSVEEMFYLFFPPICRVWSRETAHCSSSRFCRARAVRPHNPRAQQRDLAGIFLPRRHGCYRPRLPYCVTGFPKTLFPSCALGSRRCWRSDSDFQPGFLPAGFRMGPRQERPRYDHPRRRHLHGHRLRIADQLGESQSPPSSRETGSAQLRGISDPHVHSFRLLRTLRRSW